MDYNNENFLLQNQNLLVFYKANTSLLNPLLLKYKPTYNNNINISEIMIILKLFRENKCTPLFLKDLYLSKIFFPSPQKMTQKIEDQTLFTELNNIIVNAELKEDKNILHQHEDHLSIDHLKTNFA